ncbi:hypothetical protein BDZ85DRAFT_43671 [Elsinoe ampelina]|uniref:Uncharacterized protein n=1 Tax=Elsinoe ampelina TaxID=302913 RepID=A0A6A6G1I7_9PEZI|nr:hypothetical protein BDZ85DRAFT_43671 [Elsinoe ampelina]
MAPRGFRRRFSVYRSDTRIVATTRYEVSKCKHLGFMSCQRCSPRGVVKSAPACLLNTIPMRHALMRAGTTDINGIYTAMNIGKLQRSGKIKYVTDMFVTQPPVQTVILRVFIKSHVGDDPIWDFETTLMTEGRALRWGDIIDSVQRRAARQGRHSRHDRIGIEIGALRSIMLDPRSSKVQSEAVNEDGELRYRF